LTNLSNAYKFHEYLLKTNLSYHQTFTECVDKCPFLLTKSCLLFNSKSENRKIINILSSILIRLCKNCTNFFKSQLELSSVEWTDKLHTIPCPFFDSGIKNFCTYIIQNQKLFKSTTWTLRSQKATKVQMEKIYNQIYLKTTRNRNIIVFYMLLYMK
jgi:hypothetical protein